MALANLQTCSAMPFSKKTLTRVKKEKTKSQQGKGKVGDKGLGKKAVTAKLQQGKGKVGDKEIRAWVRRN